MPLNSVDCNCWCKLSEAFWWTSFCWDTCSTVMLRTCANRSGEEIKSESKRTSLSRKDGLGNALTDAITTSRTKNEIILVILNIFISRSKLRLLALVLWSFPSDDKLPRSILMQCGSLARAAPCWVWEVRHCRRFQMRSRLCASRAASRHTGDGRIVKNIRARSSYCVGFAARLIFLELA